jgi:solute carrier family 25 (adenine nucleotide translocator) protein 4/5/6/31
MPGGFVQFLQDFAMGGVSAAVSKTINAPLERCKLILQTQPGVYKGIGDCLIKLPQQEGVFAYWRGNGTNVLRYFPTQALNFAFKDWFGRMLFPNGKKNYSYWQQFGRGLAAGGGAGASSLVFVYSLDLVRTRLSTDLGKEGRYKGFVHCYVETFKEGGFRSLYKGFGISVAGIIPYRAVYFGGYDTLKAMFLNKDSSFFIKWFVSQTNTIAAQFITYPIDTVRRVQMLSGQKNKDGTVNPVFRNAFHCFQVLLKTRGIQGIYKGALANTYRATGAALCMVFYDTIKDKVKAAEEKK